MPGKRNYNKSNRILTVSLPISFRMKLLAGKIIEITKTDRRQELSAELVSLLSEASKVPAANVKISNTQQYHKKQGGKTVFKQYGYYRPESNYIYIQNLTAVQGKALAGKTFLDTLLHEWLHHYDTHKLKLDSIHTKGFYTRLKNLKEKLEVI